MKYIYLLPLCILPYALFGQIEPEKSLKIDTVIFNDEYFFVSGLNGKLQTCIGKDSSYIEFGNFTNKRCLSLISLLNNELNTKAFSNVDVAIGEYMKIPVEDYWALVSEWHFKDEKKAIKCETQLLKLKNGEIVKTIVPTAIQYFRRGNIIYMIKYSPRRKGNPEVDEIFNCLKM